MAITYDNSAIVNPGISGGHVTGSYTVGSGLNRLLLVAVHYYKTGGIGSIQSSGVTYNGVAMTSLGAVDSSYGTNNIRTELWSLKAPASGSHNVDVTISGTPSACTVGCVSLAGVDQVNTVDNTAGAGAGAEFGNSIGVGLAGTAGKAPWGFTFGTLIQPSSFMSAPSSPTVVTNTTYNGSMGSPGLPNWRLFSSYGSYSGGLNTASWTIDNSSVTNEWQLFGITVNADLPVVRAKQLFTLGECDALDLLNSLSTD